MAPRNDSFLAALSGLWFKLTTIFFIALLAILAILYFPGRFVAWMFYLTFAEASYEILVRAVFLAAAAVVLGSVSAIVAAPFLLSGKWRARVSHVAVKGIAAAAVFLVLYSVLSIMDSMGHFTQRIRFTLLALYVVLFALAMMDRKTRLRLTSQFDMFLSGKAPHAAVLAIVCGLGLTMASGMVAPASAKVSHNTPPRHPNILLVTFDALTARDMSVYGYRLPTTPRLAEFAQKATVFTNVYSSSTFTTPSLASLLTGLAPSESGVYHLPDRLHGVHIEQTLPHLLREAGYRTATVNSSPYASLFASWQSADYDHFEGPVYRTRDFLKIWDATMLLHPPKSFGDRLSEFEDLEGAISIIPSQINAYDRKRFNTTESPFPPEEVFAHARAAMKDLPDGFFVWVHVFAPHYPYLPKAHMGKFLPTQEMRTAEEQVAFAPGSLTYPLNLQKSVTKDRLRYDEFIADADSAFGDFMAGLEADGKLKDTAVIVSSDHGESFEAGVFTHATGFQTVAEIHIPLIVHLPGQDRSAQSAYTVDQTALAPTILELAGMPRGNWMHGASLVPLLEGKTLQGKTPDGKTLEGHTPAGNAVPASMEAGLAFTQYLATSSYFDGPNSGTVGVTDGVHQYVVGLPSGEGSLRYMSEPLLWYIDHTSEDPEAARRLRAALYARFPNLPGK
jgi:arylsulfatase A-like enzyme